MSRISLAEEEFKLSITCAFSVVLGVFDSSSSKKKNRKKSNQKAYRKK